MTSRRRDTITVLIVIAFVALVIWSEIAHKPVDQFTVTHG